MRRVAIVGSPGSGKSTLADRLAVDLGLRHVELDSLWRRPGWTNPPIPEFRQAVAEELADHCWVVDGNYRVVQDLVQAGADTIVLLDLARWRVTARVVRRSLWRVASRKELWGDNRETVGKVFSRDPEKSIIVWTWTQYPKYRTLYSTLAHDGSWDHAVVWHLRSPADVRHFRAAASHTLPV